MSSSLVKTIAMSIIADAGNAKDTLADISAKADELAKPHEIAIGAAGAGEARDEVDSVAEALARYDEAAADAASASARLAEVQAESGASADEVSAAADANAEAVLRERDAWLSLSEAQATAAVRSKETADTQEESAAKTDVAAASSEGLGSKMKLAGLGVAVGIGYAVDQAMKFQEASTTLVTGAGESEKALGLVKTGMLGISAATATSLPQVVSGMYMIESAGYHGAAGLLVLKAAAEGAKVGNADLGTVANAVTTVLTDYRMKATSAASATSGLVAVVAAGKTHMGDLATAISKVLPTASNLHVSFAQVGGAIATMTAEGTTARLAATHLNSTLVALASPSKTAAAAMASVGLSAQQVGSTLTHSGIVATLQEIYTATAEKFPPGSAAFVAAIKNETGGLAGLQTFLQLTGKNMGTLKADTKSVGDAMAHGKGDVQGWAEVQKDASFQLEKTKQSAKDAATAFGSALLPAVSAVLGPVSSFAAWLAKSSAASTTFAAIIGGVLSVYLGSKLVNAFSDVKSAGEKVIGVVGNVISKITGMGAASSAEAAGTEELAAAQTEQAGAAEEAAVAQGELDVAMDANPIGLIILGITALVAVIVLAVTHFKDIKHWAEDAFNWIKSNWPLLAGILLGPIAFAVGEIVTHWRLIVAGAEKAWDDVKSAFESAAGWLFDVGRSIIMGLIHGMESMIGDAVGAVKHVGESILGGIKDVLGIFSPSREGYAIGLNFGGAVGLGLGDSVPLVLDASGRLAQATMAGYTGGAARPFGGAAGSWGGGDHIEIHFDNIVTDPQGTARVLVQTLREYKRHGGGAPLGIA